MSADSNSQNETREKAWQVLRDNSREDRYTIPCRKLYPFQWNWDSCFTALGWHLFDPPRAWREYDSLLSGQWEQGKIPHIIFHQPSDSYFPGPEIWESLHDVPTSAITQPPVAAAIVRMMLERSVNSEQGDSDREAAIKILPALFRHHRWWHVWRDPDNTGMVAIYHPWESGRDNSAEWDEPLARVPVDNLKPYKRRDLELVDAEQRPTNDDYDRYMALVQTFVEHKHDQHSLYRVLPFKVADLGINMILLRATRDLLWLLQRLTPEDTSSIEQARIWIAAQESVLQDFWNPQTRAFHSVDMITGLQLPEITSASFLPLWAGGLTPAQEKALVQRLEDWAGKVKYLVPSLDPDDAKFEPHRYWRGPVWAVVNFMIADGLLRRGYDEMAERVRADTIALAGGAGDFAEYYDPLTGDPLGGSHFSWTAAVWLALTNSD